MYRTLDAGKIVQTLETLQRRISARFPESGLGSVARELIAVARRTADAAAAFAKPNLWLRAATVVAIAAGAIGQIWMARWLRLNVETISVVEFAQGLESAVNLLLLMAAAVWFLLTLEERLKRRKVLDALHELRSLAHVIDMHQLTKDPTTVLSGHSVTEASPPRVMTEFELARYLDYCAECWR